MSKQKKYEKLLALKGSNMPEEVLVADTKWKRVKVFKHDFFAATGLYESLSDGTKAVLKIFRPYSYMLLPFGLLSRWQARHETKIYTELQDTGHVPRWIGRYEKHGIMHEFVPGSDLDYDMQMEESFFDELESLLKTMHERGLSYLDTNKPDNILVGTDGKCYLIDFQITWHQPPFPLSLITAPLFAIFRNSDLYHLMKHKRKFFPEKITREDLDRFRPWYVKIHRLIANPVRKRRRAYLRKVEEGADIKPEGAEKH